MLFYHFKIIIFEFEHIFLISKGDFCLDLALFTGYLLSLSFHVYRQGLGK